VTGTAWAFDVPDDGAVWVYLDPLYLSAGRLINSLCNSLEGAHSELTRLHRVAIRNRPGYRLSTIKGLYKEAQRVNVGGATPDFFVVGTGS